MAKIFMAKIVRTKIFMTKIQGKNLLTTNNQVSRVFSHSARFFTLGAFFHTRRVFSHSARFFTLGTFFHTGRVFSHSACFLHSARFFTLSAFFYTRRIFSHSARFWGQRYVLVRGEILGPWTDPRERKHLPRMFPLIKNESQRIERD